MIDTRNFAIGTLSVTAVVLLTALIVISQLPAPRPAMAFGEVASGGDYFMFSGQIQDSNELVYVIDTAVKQLNVYGVDPARRGLLLIQRLDLERLPEPRQPKKKKRRY